MVFVVMRDAMSGGAYRGVRKAGVEGQWELARVERRHLIFQCFLAVRVIESQFAGLARCPCSESGFVGLREG